MTEEVEVDYDRSWSAESDFPDVHALRLNADAAHLLTDLPGGMTHLLSHMMSHVT